MRKQIKKWGESAVIVLTKEDLIGYDLKIGDIVDLVDMIKVEKKGNGNIN